jgi:Patatin-like phospholipase
MNIFFPCVVAQTGDWLPPAAADCRFSKISTEQKGVLTNVSSAAFQLRQMNAEPPLRILSLDGGGVRGISSLCVLQTLMDQIKLKLIRDFNPLEPIPPLRPCHFFDLICGTSTGGLIAIMLGRLEMVYLHASS